MKAVQIGDGRNSLLNVLLERKLTTEMNLQNPIRDHKFLDLQHLSRVAIASFDCF